jgi:hypothetical protein
MLWSVNSTREKLGAMKKDPISQDRWGRYKNAAMGDSTPQVACTHRTAKVEMEAGGFRKQSKEGQAAEERKGLGQAGVGF